MDPGFNLFKYTVTDTFEGVYISPPPRYGKTRILCGNNTKKDFLAWHYPESQKSND